MADKCTHPEVTERSRLYAAATLYEPAEYLVWYVCRKCGARLGAEGTQGGKITRVIGVL
jgi:hypothetical protein